MDMAFLNAANRAGDVPARGPVVRRRRPQLLLPRPPRDGRPRQARPAARRTRATTSRSPGCSRSPPPPSSRSRPRSGPPRAGRTRRCAPASARVALIVVLGNLEGARLLLADGGPLRDYDWFAASRVIDDTITEFPWFSFLLGDLHAHVLAVPFTVLALAFAVQVVLDGPRLAPRGRGVRGAVRRLARARPALRDQLLVVSDHRRRAAASRCSAGCATGAATRTRPAVVRWLLAAIALSALLVLPFHLSFDPAAKGIGWVGEGRGFAGWVRDQLLLFGSLAVFVALAFLGRLAVTARPGRNAVWIAVAAVFAGSLLAALDLRAHRAARRAARRRARGGHVAARMPSGAAGGLGAARRRRRLPARARGALRARRVRRRPAVPHEHGLQARLPGLVPARARRHRRARLVADVAAAPRGAPAGRRRGRRRPRRRARLPDRGHVRAQGRLRPLADARRPRLAARPRARRRRRDRLAQRPTRPAGAGRARVGGRGLLRLRPRADLHLHGACPPCWAGRATSSSGATTRAPGGRTSPRSTRRRDDRDRPRAARPLRDPLRRRRPAGAHGPRRRGRGEVGPARRARLRERRHRPCGRSR